MAVLSSKYLSEVERGKANISIELLQKLADVLNVELRELLPTEHECSHSVLIKKVAVIATKIKGKRT